MYRLLIVLFSVFRLVGDDWIPVNDGLASENAPGFALSVPFDLWLRLWYNVRPRTIP